VESTKNKREMKKRNEKKKRKGKAISVELQMNPQVQEHADKSR